MSLMPNSLLSLLLCCLLFGCATSAPAQVDFQKPAREAIEAAVAAGADQHAPLELRFAREKLAAAEQANAAGDGAQAKRLARQAQVDAELCVAKIGAALAREAARRQRETNQQLQAELSEPESGR